MEKNVILEDLLTGVWSGNAFPTQETTLVFCKDRKGLMFFYWGSCAESPFVDEFYWQVHNKSKIFLEWISKHNYNPDSEDDTLIIDSGQNEAAPFEIIDQAFLKIEVGMHYSFDSTLRYIRKAESFEVEKEKLIQLAENFNPFSSDRQIWLFDDQNWRKLPPDSAKTGKKPWWKFW